MFFAVRAEVPRKVVLTGSSSAPLGRSSGRGGSAGIPPRAPGALGRASFVGAGFSTVGVRREAGGPGCGCASGEACAGAGAGPAAAGVGSPRLASGCEVASGFRSGVSAAAPSPPPMLGALCDLKYSAHVSSTELGSVVYLSYISSSSQSLAPKSTSGALVDDSSGTMATGRLLPGTNCSRSTRLRPAPGLLPARSGRRYLGYPSLRPGNHRPRATRLVSETFVDHQSRRVRAVRSMTPAPNMRQAIRQTSMVKTTKATLRIAVMMVEMMIIA
jgi:hypothetical protein